MPASRDRTFVRQLFEREAVALTTEAAAHKARAIAARSSVISDDVVAAITEMRERPT